MARLPNGSHADLPPFAPAAQRTLPLLGAVAELVFVPARRDRPGQADRHRPALAPGPAARIVERESYWRDGDLALTPNRYPFARGQRILWRTSPAREPDLGFWLAAHRWLEDGGGTVLLNNIGAAATIARAHAHLIDERLPFLSQLPERPLTDAPIEPPPGAELVHKDVPFCVVGVRGPAEARARALMLLADARLTATWNVVADAHASWVVPRTIETPAPDFTAPLGSAEFWGRWCYTDETAFTNATSEQLERALRAASAPPLR